MNLILLGAPGSGKGTQAALLAKEFNIIHISTGDIFRAAVSSGTDLGKKAKEYMDKGELVPDNVVIGMVKERLREPDVSEGFLLDGFPRTVPQAQALEETLEEIDKALDGVIDIEVNKEEIVRRLTSRRVCVDCKAVYNLLFNPPENADYCDACGSRLSHRSDDSIETVNKRLKVYDEQTEPLIEHYRNKGLLRSVNGQQSVDTVFKDIITVVQGDYA